MNLFDIIFLGILQGIIEWLPISSQGNITLLLLEFFELEYITAINLSIILHIGTTLAAIVYFRNELYNIIKNNTNKKDELASNIRTFLIISTLVTGILGYVIYSNLSRFNFGTEILIALIGTALIISGIIQKTSRIYRISNRKNLDIRDAILIGIVQSFSVMPGISRSGITVSYLLLRGIDVTKSIRISFLMSIPTIIASQIGLILIQGFDKLPITNILVGILSSFLVGLLTINLILKLAKQIQFWIFCIIIGILSFLPLIVIL